MNTRIEVVGECHSRAGGNPVDNGSILDPRLRGDDS